MNDPLFHRFKKTLEKFVSSESLLLVAVSGGADSMALLNLLVEVRRSLGFEIKVLHCFHGSSEDENLLNFRMKAYQFVSEFCQKSQLDFHSNYEGMKDVPSKTSEAELRGLRYSFFSQVLSSNEIQRENTYLLTGHHQEDALETTLIQLIRGVGPLSFRASASVFNSVGNEHYKGQILRPLVSEPKSELVRYLEASQQSFMKDPSNENDDPLRNWIRNSWLPQLEDKRQGSRQSLARSLRLMGGWISDTSHHLPLDLISERGIARSEFQQLSHSIKSSLVKHYLHRALRMTASQSQIEEAIKRLDTRQKDLSFSLAGCHWQTNKDWIKVSAPVVPYGG